MVYIYFEDSTSGYDFISNIIIRAIQPNVPYKIMPSLKGYRNCNLFLEKAAESKDFPFKIRM
jgi:hypothetical protein